MILKVHVATSETLLIKHSNDAIAEASCKQAEKLVQRNKGVLIERKKVSAGEYLLVVYFSTVEMNKEWKADLKHHNVELETVATSRTYIITDDESDSSAKCFCAQAKNSSSHYKGSVVTEKKLKEGAYLLVVYFSDEGMMRAWEISTGMC